VGSVSSTDLDPRTMLDLRAELAVHGLRATAPPVRRRAGAGPSDDGHWRLRGEPCGGGAATLPMAEDSPFALDDLGRLTRDGVVVEELALEPVERPRFYDLQTDDGIAYEALARLHGTDVLATTVVQTCIRYTREDTRCRFCTIEESLRAGATPQVKRPEQLAEVAEAAWRLDGVRQMVMTTGTSNGPDRGARHLARCVAAVKAAVPLLPIQVQIEPPLELTWIDTLNEAGADAVGIHIESLDQNVRERWTPGKATVPVARYEQAWRHAVEVFGHNRVSTYLLVGLGEDPDELVAGARRLIAMGVYPFVVPYRPLLGSLAAADGVPAPDPALLAQVTGRVGRALQAAGMRGADQGAGCAACGACSALASVDG
jgi:radical SAM protein (TIGR04043 family)